MPRQFMIRKSSPDKDIIKMHPIKVEDSSFAVQHSSVDDSEDLTQSDVTKPFDLSTKPKIPNKDYEMASEKGPPAEELPDRNRSPEAISNEPENMADTSLGNAPDINAASKEHIPKQSISSDSNLPSVKTLYSGRTFQCDKNLSPPKSTEDKLAPPLPREFKPKIVSPNTDPPIGIAMIDRNKLPSPPLQPTGAWESLRFPSSSSSDIGAPTAWQRPLYPQMLHYPTMSLMRPWPSNDYSNSISLGRPWNNGLCGGGVIMSSTPIFPRLKMPTCYPQEYFENPFHQLGTTEHLKENYGWSKHEDSLSPVARPDSDEVSKESPSRFNPLVSSSTGSPPSSQTHRYFCSACNKSYATHSGLSRHTQFHCITLEKKDFNCTVCNKVYSSLGALKMHIRTHTLPCKCTICGKAFSRPWLLQGHIRTHTGEKPFSCSHCSRSFADRSNLRAHLQTHSDVKKYSCKGCSKTFSRMSLLMKHNEGGCGVLSNGRYTIRPLI